MPGQTPSQTIASESVLNAFPLHPPEMVRETVTVAHFYVKRVKELVDARPALARAAVDWGFGDWEDALGAASHIGNREIAEYLLSKSARPSIFSAAMLGQLDVVRAFITAQPGVQRTAGPHSISLLSHARAGGKQAQAVFDYLNSLEDAGEAPASLKRTHLALRESTFSEPSPINESRSPRKLPSSHSSGKGRWGAGSSI